MEEVVPDTDYQALQQFISNSPWDAQAVMDETALRASELIGDPKDAYLIIDETSFTKKGKKSVGVSRQYLGCEGKVDNGQVGVFTALCKDSHVALLHGRVYLPQEWVNDRGRCSAAKIPEDERDFRTKDKLALEQVRRARNLGVQFGWVLADAGYGKGPDFLFGLDDMNERFLVDVHKDFIVYKADPRPHVPRKTALKGRRPTLAKTSALSMQVQEWVWKMPASSWKEIALRDSTQGTVTYKCMRMPVWIWDKGTHRVLACHLVARQDPTTGEFKYSLSNASKNMTLTKLAKAQGQRYWIERSFQDAKGACGMADYQVQGWIGWHHHMALVMMALLFMMEQRVEQPSLGPKLTCKEIEMILARMLPRKDLTVDDLVDLIRKRVERRTAIFEKTRLTK